MVYFCFMMVYYGFGVTKKPYFEIIVYIYNYTCFRAVYVAYYGLWFPGIRACSGSFIGKIANLRSGKA